MKTSPPFSSRMAPENKAALQIELSSEKTEVPKTWNSVFLAQAGGQNILILVLKIP